jgi:predicted Holliday junction resolvase-like endonuclease
MQELIKSDVFFFITSVAVVILTILIAVLVSYLIKVTRDIKYISHKAKLEADNLSKDLENLRASALNHSGKLKTFFTILTGFAKRSSGKKGKNND